MRISDWGKRLVFVLGALLCFDQAFAISYSDLISHVQEKFANQSKEYPIVVFDRDELNWRFLKARAFGKENEPKRAAIIREYLLEKFQLNLSTQEIISFIDYVSTFPDMALAIPIKKDGFDDKEYKACLVVSASPNSNQRLSTERVLQLAMKEIYGELDFNALLPRLSYDELRRFSLYHEVSHCLDRKFLPSVNLMSGDSHDVHLSESFAEVMALFLLAQEGFSNLGKTRAIHRAIYSRKMGPYFRERPELAFGDEMVMDGGLIYYLSPVLEKAQQIIDSYEDSIKSFSLEDLFELTESIVKEEALHFRTMFAVRSFFEDGEEVALANALERKIDFPELFADAYEDLQKYIADSDVYLREAFVVNYQAAASSAREAVSLKAIDMIALCDSLLVDDRKEFFQRLELYRDELSLSESSIESQRERAKKLNSIFAELSLECDDYSIN